MPIKVERRLIQLGNTLSVSIPKSWIDYYGLKAKDQVILIANGEIVIRRIEKDGEEPKEKTGM